MVVFFSYRETADNIETYRVKVLNLSEKFDKISFIEKFAAHGEIVNRLKIIKQQVGNGFCVIEYRSQKEAQNAMASENGSTFEGNVLRVYTVKVKE